MLRDWQQEKLRLFWQPFLPENSTTLEDQGFEIESLTRLGRFVCLDVETVQVDVTVNGNLCEERFTSFFSAY